jgi:hypothetical protein
MRNNGLNRGIARSNGKHIMQSQVTHVHTFSFPASDPSGIAYSVRVLGAQRHDGTWQGWLEFTPENAVGPVLTTDQETSQPDLKALEYWAGGLEPVYLSGALERAKRRASGG